MLLAFGLAGQPAGASPPSVAQLQVQAAIAQYPKYVIILGDSLLAGAVSPIGGKGIVNLAEGGATLEMILRDQVPQVAGIIASALAQFAGVILMGGSDNLAAIEAGTETWDQFSASLTSIYKALIAAGIPANRILACSPPPTMSEPDFAYVQGMNAYYVMDAAPFGIGVVNMIQLYTDNTLSFPPNRTYFWSDAVHDGAAVWQQVYNPWLGANVQPW